MDAYVQEVRKLENKFSGLEIHHVIHDHNIRVGVLSKLGSTRAQVPAGVFIQELKHPSIKSPAQVTTDPELQGLDQEVMMLGEDWRKPISTSPKTKDYPQALTRRVQ
ncbi:uncharacterized protein LOC112900633 [Panicum hallii]|jgi:hypothetical protein|uniref:uncharacterized protein LOC112900633 n=1 Tax=Panicum hallii TaxID=206008 RepID=UPI000DF4CC6C|nr:uncharacterized protein LOC112900633 [Panicum hallii]